MVQWFVHTGATTPDRMSPECHKSGAKAYTSYPKGNPTKHMPVPFRFHTRYVPPFGCLLSYIPGRVRQLGCIHVAGSKETRFSWHQFSFLATRPEVVSRAILDAHVFAALPAVGQIPVLPRRRHVRASATVTSRGAPLRDDVHHEFTLGELCSSAGWRVECPRSTTES